MCNLSLTEGIFPISTKTAVVRPRLKKSYLNLDDLNLFRPISNLSFISKTVERVVATQFTVHAETNKLLPGRQSAYHACHSTETAVLGVHNDIVRAIDDGKVCALVLLDLSAAFDTVDHAILLRILEHRVGVKNEALNWFKSYLADRTQTFQVNTQQSGLRAVDCSVPQGTRSARVHSLH